MGQLTSTQEFWSNSRVKLGNRCPKWTNCNYKQLYYWKMDNFYSDFSYTARMQKPLLQNCMNLLICQFSSRWYSYYSACIQKQKLYFLNIILHINPWLRNHLLNKSQTPQYLTPYSVWYQSIPLIICLIIFLLD